MHSLYIGSILAPCRLEKDGLKLARSDRNCKGCVMPKLSELTTEAKSELNAALVEVRVRNGTTLTANLFNLLPHYMVEVEHVTTEFAEWVSSQQA